MKVVRRRDRSALLVTALVEGDARALPGAAGVVTGMLPTFEIGVPWPGLMGPSGAAFGIPFAVEGTFFFLGAVFTAVYLRLAGPAGK